MYRKRFLLVVGLLVILSLGAAYLLFPWGHSTSQSARLGMTPYPDTTLPLYGIEKGIFAAHGVDLKVVDQNWDQQLEFVAGGGCDIAMTTLDGLVAKAKNLDASDRAVYYILPAWLFRGLVFVSPTNITPLSEFRTRLGDKEARKAFLAQLRDKKLVLPFGTHYETALRTFISSAGDDSSKYTFVNVPVETGIDALSDSTVGLAAAPIVARQEAIRRGYRIALDTVDLDVIVLTGFIVSARVTLKHTAKQGSIFSMRMV